MFRFLCALFVFTCLGNVGRSQEVAIVLSGKLFDRGLTKEESEEVQTRLELANKNGEESSLAIETYRLLDTRAKALKQVRCTTIAAVGKTFRSAAEAEDMLLHARVNLLKLDDSGCELDLSCAVGTMSGSSVQAIGQQAKMTTKLHQLQIVGSSEMQSIQNGKKQTSHLTTTLIVLPAEDHPLSAPQLIESLMIELRKKIQIPQSGKLTSVDYLLKRSR